MKNLINLNQSGFLKNRFITDHIRTLDDTFNLANTYNISGMILSLGFERAFDSVEKETLLAVIRKFNFGTNFIAMIKILINNTESCTHNGGFLSIWFKAERDL